MLSMSLSNPRILLSPSGAWGLRDSETILVLFEDVSLADIHTKCVAIQPKDLALAE